MHWFLQGLFKKKSHEKEGCARVLFLLRKNKKRRIFEKKSMD
jgi:hypothetical protein